VVPITGPRTVGQLDDYLAALDLELGADVYDRIDVASRIPLGQPHEQNATQRSVAVGGDGFRRRPIASA
jgi:hypothetical protein